MLSQLLQAILAIPRLISQIETLIKFMRRAEENHWFEKSITIERKLNEARTANEKMESAKDLQDLIRKS